MPVNPYVVVSSHAHTEARAHSELINYRRNNNGNILCYCIHAPWHSYKGLLIHTLNEKEQLSVGIGMKRCQCCKQSAQDAHTNKTTFQYEIFRTTGSDASLHFKIQVNVFTDAGMLFQQPFTDLMHVPCCIWSKYCLRTVCHEELKEGKTLR